MFKKTVAYKDLNGENVKEDVYFHLSEVELIEYEGSVHGGIHGEIEKVMTNGTGKEIIAFIKDLILSAYGERSEDGRAFLKDEERTALFAQSVAFNEVLFEVLQGEDKASNFINALFPEAMRKRVEALHEKAEKDSVAAPQDRKASSKPAAKAAPRKTPAKKTTA